MSLNILKKGAVLVATGQSVVNSSLYPSVKGDILLASNFFFIISPTRELANQISDNIVNSMQIGSSVVYNNRRLIGNLASIGGIIGFTIAIMSSS